MSLGLSGIVAVLFCGMCQAHYTYPNMSKESQRRTKEFFELLNLMAENFIFSYIGLSFFTYKCHQWNASFIGWSVITILVARAAIVYPLSWMMNRTRKSKSKIPINFQHCLWCAGLRGAIAFALAMRNAVGTQNQMILSTTLVIVLVTVRPPARLVHDPLQGAGARVLSPIALTRSHACARALSLALPLSLSPDPALPLCPGGMCTDRPPPCCGFRLPCVRRCSFSEALPCPCCSS